MGCKCNVLEIILGIIILVFSFVSFYSKWIIVIAAILLIIHALMCKSCKMCANCNMDKSMGKSGSKMKKK